MSNVKVFITQPLCTEEVKMEKFISEHKINKGKLLHIYSMSLGKNEQGIETTYYTLCFKFSDGKYYSAKRVSFHNILCSSAAKPVMTEQGKPIKYIIIRFKLMTRDEIASGDYVMPNTSKMTPEEAQAVQTRYDQNIDDFVRENNVLVTFHTALEYEWQALNARMKQGEQDERGYTITPAMLSPDEIIGSTVLDKIKTKDEKGYPLIKKIDPPRYTWKIPVFHPNKKHSNAARAFDNRLGQVYIKNDKFIPAVCDFEASKLASKNAANGVKTLVEAKLKCVKDGVQYEEPLTAKNVSNFITRKSKLGGSLDVSQSSVSAKGHNIKIIADHLVVKRHKSEEKDKGLTDEQFDAMANTDDGFAEVEETYVDYNALHPESAKQNNTEVNQAQTTSHNNADISALADIPVQFGNMTIASSTPTGQINQQYLNAIMQANMQKN